MTMPSKSQSGSVSVMPVGSPVVSSVSSVQLSSQWKEAAFFLPSARMLVRTAVCVSRSSAARSAQVMLAAGRPADRFEQVVGMELDDAAGRQAAVEGFGDLRRGPDQDVGVPNRRDAEFRVGADFNPNVADMVFDRRKAGLLGQAEKRPLHRVALVANRDVREIGGEQVGLMISPGREAFRHALYPGCL